MLSGYLLIPKEEDFYRTWHRTWTRLLIPLFFWFAVYIKWDMWWLTKHHDLLDVLQSIATGSMYHMYFLVILAGLYLVLPVIRLVKAKLSSKEYDYLIIATMLLGVVLYAAQYFVVREYTLFNFATFWVPYLGYFLLGDRLRKPLGSQLVLALGYGVSVVTTIALGYLNVWLQGQGIGWFWRSSGVSYFDEYLGLNVNLMASTLFQLLLHSQIWQKAWFQVHWFKQILHELAQASFGVFIIHFLVISFIDFRFRFAIEFLSTDLFTYIITRSAIVIVTSFVLAMVGRRLPLIRSVLGG